MQKHECCGEKYAILKRYSLDEDLSHHMLNSDFVSLQVTKDFGGSQCLIEISAKQLVKAQRQKV